MLIEHIEKIEDINNFREFLDAGIGHLLNDPASTSMHLDDIIASSLGDDSAKPASKLSSDTVSQLKSILESVDRYKSILKTGLLRTEDVYSTSPDDYIGNPSKLSND